MNRSQTSTKPRPGTNSPGKQRVAAGNGPNASGIQNAYGIDDTQQYMVTPQYVDQRDLVRGLSEKEVEIEHLRTTIVALNEKAEVLEDMRKDVFALKELLRGSETHRYELQQQLIETSRKVQEDTFTHQEYQQRLIADNERLR